jgi:excisionase family DNA binding protein
MAQNALEENRSSTALVAVRTVMPAAVASMPEWFSPETLAAFFGVPVASVYAWRHKRTGPQGIKVGRHVRYRRAEVERWLKQQAAKESTSPA